MNLVIFGFGCVVGGCTLSLILGILSFMSRPADVPVAQARASEPARLNPSPFALSFPGLHPSKNHYSFKEN
jgi:hypothetical protein